MQKDQFIHHIQEFYAASMVKILDPDSPMMYESVSAVTVEKVEDEQGFSMRRCHSSDTYSFDSVEISYQGKVVLLLTVTSAMPKADEGAPSEIEEFLSKALLEGARHGNWRGPEIYGRPSEMLYQIESYAWHGKDSLPLTFPTYRRDSFDMTELIGNLRGGWPTKVYWADIHGQFFAENFPS